ncbi:hypothetical protein, partial [Bacillus licheniformis]
STLQGAYFFAENWMCGMCRNGKDMDETTKERNVIMKRKVARNEAALNNKTPAESMHDHQYMTQYDAENGDRGANRNSKHGKQGESHQ